MPSNTMEDEYDNGHHSQTSGQSMGQSVVTTIQHSQQSLKHDEEAERMKGLGNKYMANKNYKKAYNSYSAALQLSPVGPNSHIFYCNRAASLLSLKKYPQAASDAKRSLELSNDFSKAYARLGQALYFMRNYSEAAEAYEAANKLEPDNHVTRQYLHKVYKKLERQKRHVSFDLNSPDNDYNDDSKQDKNTAEFLPIPRNTSEEEKSFITNDNHTSSESLVSEDITFYSENIVQEYREAESQSSNKKPEEQPEYYDADDTDEADEADDEVEDPDEIEAKKFLQYGLDCLEIKEFRHAIDAFSAALFLCPNHPLLTFQICVGRANAHNHTKRHEAAASDARLAIGVRPDIPHGYSLLGRSLYYCKDYAGAIIALEEALRLVQPNEEPNIYDAAYLRKAQDAMAASGTDDSTIGTAATTYTSMTLKSTYTTSTKSIPKLKPPRFVSREQIVAKGSNLPPMPSKWPTQSVSSNTFRLGKEREVYFREGALGIKLNRGCDGFVRILSTFVSKDDQRDHHGNRTGSIYPGDIVREAAGVDLRRPITNVMWGDTVALIKMAPRPILFIVAKELSTPPTQVLDELGKAAAEEMHLMLLDGANKKNLNKLIVPSPVCGDEPVQDFVEHTNTILNDIESSSLSVDNDETVELNDENHEKIQEQEHPLSITNENLLDTESLSDDQNKEESKDVGNDDIVEFNENDVADPPLETDDHNESINDQKLSFDEDVIKPTTEEKRTSHDRNQLGGEILFDVNKVTCSLPIIPWNATSNTRKLIMHGHVFILKKNRFFGERLIPRLLALFRNPSVLLILRRPENVGEVKKLLDLPRKTRLEGMNGNSILESYFVAESVIDLAMCKLRLSTLTTETSVDTSDNGIMNLNVRQKSLRANCFEIITPSESHWISLVSEEEEIANIENLVVETSCWETALTYDLHTLHKSSSTDDNVDQGWKHEIVLGTLHSHVVLGDTKSLTMALSIIKGNESDDQAMHAPNGGILYHRKRSMHSNINIIDDHGWTALHHACYRRANAAVSLLVNAGADCNAQTPILEKSPCHLSAEVLDVKSLSLLLSASSERPDPNALDANGNTPMYVCALYGKSVGQLRDPTALKKCLSALGAWGGKLILPEKEAKKQTWIHPVAMLASQVHAEELSAVLSNVEYMFPLTRSVTGDQYASLEIKFDFPIHMTLITLLKYVLMLGIEKKKNASNSDFFLHDFKSKTEEAEIVRTIKVLLNHGFEPNQRCFFLHKDVAQALEINAMHSFTPLQILALTAYEAEKLLTKIGKESEIDKSDANKINDLNEANQVIEEIECIKKCILQLGEIFVKNGARFNISVPHLHSKSNVDASFSEKTHDNDTAALNSEASITLFSLFKKSLFEFDGNFTILNNLIGSDKIDSFQTQWYSIKKVNGVGKIMLHQKVDLKSPHEIAVGKDMAPACYICWKTFGRVMNRKHTCRVTGRVICDDCSSRRIIEGGEEFRISDGQFNLAKLEAEKEKIRSKHEEVEKRQERRARLTALQSARYIQKAAGTRDRPERKESFGSDLGKDLFRLVTGEKVSDKRDQKESSVSQLEGLASSLEQTRNNLNERGEKLHNLSDKTAALAEQSREFSKLAKELRQNQSKGFFSLFD